LTFIGKSTQLPAFLLENEPDRVKIVVAQPRRIAATGVASRVAEERGEKQPGVDSVGYVVRGDAAVCDRTRILFCTTGVLLRQLQNEDALKCITHIVVDEVHERGLDSDVLLGLLKKYLPSNPHLHIVLMSATLDVDRFTHYFDGITPHIHIAGRTFPVEDFTLEDVLQITSYIPPKNKRKGNQRSNYNGYKQTRTSAWNDSEKSDEDIAPNEFDRMENDTSQEVRHCIPMQDLLKRIDETTVDNELIASLVKHLVSNKDPTDDGSILIFLPGVAEINSLLETIKHYTKGMPLLLLPLHGGLQPKEQSKVFPRAANGFTKIILSTNVAETSVTIPDCTVVIDTYVF
jgi:ATP-dependent RNA helicase DHX57